MRASRVFSRYAAQASSVGLVEDPFAGARGGRGRLAAAHAAGIVDDQRGRQGVSAAVADRERHVGARGAAIRAVVDVGPSGGGQDRDAVRLGVRDAEEFLVWAARPVVV